MWKFHLQMSDILLVCSELFIFNRDGTKTNEQINYKKIVFIESSKHYLIERRRHSAAGQAHAVPVAN